MRVPPRTGANNKPGGNDGTICSHAAISVGSVLAVLAAVSSAPAANISGDPGATCSGLVGAGRQRGADRFRHAPGAVTACRCRTRGRRRRRASRRQIQRSARCLAISRRPTPSAADQIRGQSAGRMERPLAAIWRRRLQRRADHRARPAAGLSLRQAFAAGARLRHLRHRFRPRDQARRAAADRLRSTPRLSRILPIAPTRKCATPRLR